MRAGSERALGRAWRWHRLLEEGKYPSIKALARAEGVHHAYVAKLLRLTPLAPDVVEAVLHGRRRKGLSWRTWSGRCRRTGRGSASIEAACSQAASACGAGRRPARRLLARG